MSASQVEIPLSQASSAVSVITGAELRDAAGDDRRRRAAAGSGADGRASGSAGALTSDLSSRRRIRLHARLHRRHPGERVRRRFRFRAPVHREHRPHRNRARAAERALRIERDRRGRADRDRERRAGPRRRVARRRQLRVDPRLAASSSGGAATGRGVAASIGSRATDSTASTRASGEEIDNDRLRADGRRGQRRLARRARARRCAASCASGATIAASPVRSARTRSASSPVSIDIARHGRSMERVDSAASSRSGDASARTGRSRGTRSTASSSQLIVRASGSSLSRSGRDASPRGRRPTSAAGPGSTCPPALEFQRERGTSSYITDNTGEIPIERWVAGYFGEARWSPAERLFATGGVRVEDIHRDAVGRAGRSVQPPASDARRHVVSVNPKITAAYYLRPTPGTQTQVRAAAGTGIRPPDGFELAFTDNPSLQPERSRSVEAGVDQAFASGRGLIEATWFRNTFDDLIVAVGGSSSRAGTAPTTSQTRARRGWSSPRRFGPSARASTSRAASATPFSTARFSPSIGAAAAPPPFHAGQPLLNRPRHQWAIDASATRGRCTAWIRGGGRGRVLAVEPSFGTFGGLFDAAGYAVWNAGASWRCRAQLELFGRVENLFDRVVRRSLRLPRARRVVRWQGCGLLQAADVVFGYPDRPPVLRGVTMDVPANGFVGILGPNGSGKTTLLRALAGVLRPTQRPRSARRIRPRARVRGRRWPAGWPSCRRRPTSRSITACSKSC